MQETTDLLTARKSKSNSQTIQRFMFSAGMRVIERELGPDVLTRPVTERDLPAKLVNFFRYAAALVCRRSGTDLLRAARLFFESTISFANANLDGVLSVAAKAYKTVVSF